MPPRKTKSGPRKGKGMRKGMRKGKGKNHLNRKSYSNATDSINKKFICSATVAPTQGVTVANYVYNFFPLWDQNAGIPTMLTQNAEFLLNCKLYDRWRPRGITVNFKPHANTLDQAMNQNDGYNYSGDGLMHTVIDRNSVPNSGDMATFMRYGSHRAKSLTKSQSRSYWIKLPVNVWFSTSALPTPQYVSQYGGYGIQGGIGFYAENLIEDVAELYNEPIGVYSISYHIEFSGKILPKVLSTVDLSGNQILVLSNSPSSGNPLQVPGQTLTGSGTTTTTVYNTQVIDLSGTPWAVNT